VVDGGLVVDRRGDVHEVAMLRVLLRGAMIHDVAPSLLALWPIVAEDDPSASVLRRYWYSFILASPYAIVKYSIMWSKK
jgi:hypothetical protein